MNNIPDTSKVLLQIFTGVLDENFIQQLINHINELLPNINILGTTTDGEISNDKVLANSTVLSFSVFDDTQVKIYTTPQQTIDYETGKSLVSQFEDIENVKVAIVFADGLSTNGEIFLKAFYDTKSDLTISGGLAGDNGKFEQTYIFTKKGINKGGAIAAVLYNPDLIVNTSFSFGWEKIGKELIITKAKENVVFTIDNIPATELYKKYLGDTIGDKLPTTGIEFPLLLQRNQQIIARAVVGKNLDGSLVFAGNINEGDRVYLGYGNIENILNNRFSLYHDLSKTPIETTFVYSCLARKILLGEDIKNEVLPLCSIAPMSGFFTYGEFFSHHNKAQSCENHLLNETMTVLTLSEKKQPLHQICDENNSSSKQMQSIQALSHLISVTSKELNNLNKNLQKKVEEEVALNLKQSISLLEQSKMASMGEMLGNIAHQWRQPLNSISMEASSILVDITLGIGLDNESVSNKMNNIISKSEYLSSTINTFRNFLKEEKEFAQVMIQERLKVVFEVVGTVLKDAHIELIYEDKTKSEVKLEMVVGELDQVLINIINNAKDILEEKRIKKPWIKIVVSSSKNEVLITLEDNGGGVSEDILGRIFEPYFTTKHQSQGTGLGLHMSYKIITESLHGKIYVQNTNNGAKFFINLPIV
jgi:signal transduction histidine kinase